MEGNANGQGSAAQSFLTKAQQVALDAALLSKEKAARAIPSKLLSLSAWTRAQSPQAAQFSLRHGST